MNALTEQEREKLNQAEYEEMLIKRFKSGNYLSKADRQTAKRLIKQREISAVADRS